MTQATDVLTPEDAKSIVRRAPSEVVHTARLEAYVSAISQKLDELVGPIVRRTVTGEEIDGTGQCHLRVRRWPVHSFTTVLSYQQGVSTTLTAETVSVAGDYRAEKWADDPTLLSGRLLRRSSWSSQYWAYGNTFVVTYQAGRYATTAAVAGSRYWEAAALMLKSLWRAEETTAQLSDDDFFEPVSTVPGFLVPRAVKEMLADQIQYAGVA